MGNLFVRSKPIFHSNSKGISPQGRNVAHLSACLDTGAEHLITSNRKEYTVDLMCYNTRIAAIRINQKQ